MGKKAEREMDGSWIESQGALDAWSSTALQPAACNLLFVWEIPVEDWPSSYPRYSE